MSELGAIADRLEQIGHPGPSAAVRVLEFMLSLRLTDDLERVLDHAYIRLRDDGQPEMMEALRAAVIQLDERRAARKEQEHAAFRNSMYGQWPNSQPVGRIGPR